VIAAEQSEGKELTKEEKQRLRKEKKQQKKNKEKKEDKAPKDGEKEKKPVSSAAPASQLSTQPATQKAVPAPAPVSVPAPEAAAAPADKPAKSKAELKAERRARQEADRATKQGKKGDAGQQAPTSKPKAPPSELQPVVKRLPEHVQVDNPDVLKKLAKKLERQQIPLRSDYGYKVSLFSHLHQYRSQSSSNSATQVRCIPSTVIHPANRSTGSPVFAGHRSGSNARSVALLLLQTGTITTPPNEELSSDLVNRPHCIFTSSMGNAIKYIKKEISIFQVSAKKKRLVSHSETDMKSGHIHLCSALVNHILCEAFEKSRKFRCDRGGQQTSAGGQRGPEASGPGGHQLHLRFSSQPALSYVLPEVLMTGTSQIALVAKAFNGPVLVGWRDLQVLRSGATYSFVSNELDDPDDLIVTRKGKTQLEDWQQVPSLGLLNLVYDVTPPDFVDLVITDLGMIPCTSVPVVLRVKNVDQ
uniref:Translation initiation factor eIF2B subunit delta n=1 Tax=Salarias fasciatus TaxID=181472 RepID=A0A672FCW0_SALFA